MLLWLNRVKFIKLVVLSMYMQAWIFLYVTKGVEPKIVTKMMEQLFGKSQKSNYGQYEYEINGILSKGDYIRPVRAVLIVKDEHMHKVVELFEMNKIRNRIFEIKLELEDFEKSQLF